MIKNHTTIALTHLMIHVTASTAETAAAYGLFPAGDFRLTTGECRQSAGIAPALWYFRKECIAVPRAGHALAGFDPRLSTEEDLQRWCARTPPGAAPDYPALVWAGSPLVIDPARLDARGERLLTADGAVDFVLAPRLASNRAYYDAASRDFFARRVLRLRGSLEIQAQSGPAPRFVARSIWPADFRIDAAAPLQALAPGALAIREWLRSEPGGGAQSAFATRLLWQRRPAAAARRAGRPLIGIMLNGAQGDDDEAHGGHFGLCTGRVGANGEMHDWLIANFYTLDAESEKGIIAAMLPLDAYLADLNSGQAWYRPSYMLVATLRDERTAAHLSSALARVFNQFYRHQFVYRHASANCTGISMSTLRALGWQVPTVGPVSWLKAVAALPAQSLSTGSLAQGCAMFDYLSEEQTRLLPARAFEGAAADLLDLVAGRLKRTLTPYEALLAQDVDEIMLLRIPQLPSSRAWGNYPVATVAEYRERLPHDPAQQQIVPVGPRPFPRHLVDPQSPPLRPERSDYALAAYAVGLLALGAWALRALWRGKRGTRGD